MYTVDIDTNYSRCYFTSLWAQEYFVLSRSFIGTRTRRHFPPDHCSWDKLVGELNIPELSSVRPRPRPRLPTYLHDDIILYSNATQHGETLESIPKFSQPTPTSHPTAPPKSLTPPTTTPTSSPVNLDPSNVGLLKPVQWKLLPPSAFTAHKT